MKDVLKKVEKFRRKIDTASDQSESDKSTGSPSSRLNKYSRIVDSLVKKHCSYKSNRVDSKELQAFRRTLPMYTQRDKHRKQVINKMKADMKAHKQQNIDKAAHDEKQLQLRYYHGEPIDKQYAVPQRYDRFAQPRDTRPI